MLLPMVHLADTAMAKAGQHSSRGSRKSAQGRGARSGQADPATDLSARVMAMFTTRAIERSQALYLQTGNPIHAWHVYEHARQGGVAIPDSVLDYLDQVAKALTASPGPASLKAVATDRVVAASDRRGPWRQPGRGIQNPQACRASRAS